MHEVVREFLVFCWGARGDGLRCTSARPARRIHGLVRAS